MSHFLKDICISRFLIYILSTLLFISYMLMPDNVIKNTIFVDQAKNYTLKETNGNQIPYGYSIFTPGCKIQDYDPLDSSLTKSFDPHYKFECIKLPSLIRVIPLKTLIVDFKVLPQYGGHLEYCLYIPIFRYDNGYTDNSYEFGQTQRFFDFIIALHEFVKIECYNSFDKIYEDFFPFIFRKSTVEKKCQMIEKRNKLMNNNQEKLSISIIGIDSVSRLNFIRYCQKTREYLVKNMKAIELKGYNKVGDNTFHNLVPLLHGSYISELKWFINQPFDKLSFIWKEYSMNGYRTFFAEDDPPVTLFNYMKEGFYFEPSDYYLRPFYLSILDSELYRESQHQCLGNRFNHNILLDYTYDFLKTFNNELYFSFLFMSSLTHGYITAVQSGDIHYKAFLKKVNEENLLNNTILFFLSDHGIRFGKFRATYFGRLEERLPMAYIVFPRWFQETYPEIIKTVKKNSRRLTTPFDIYATFKDLLQFNRTKRKISMSMNRGISLFDEIPEERTCEDATILPHWCTCQEKTQLSNNDTKADMVADYIVYQINELTKSNRDVCMSLTLNSIMEVWISFLNPKVLKYEFLLGNGNDERIKFKKDKVADVEDITIVLKTDPSNAEFEATVRYYIATHQMKLAGDISRINKYGEQSNCVQDFNLKKYCYCKDFVNKSKII